MTPYKQKDLPQSELTKLKEEILKEVMEKLDKLWVCHIEVRNGAKMVELEDVKQIIDQVFSAGRKAGIIEVKKKMIEKIEDMYIIKYEKEIWVRLEKVKQVINMKI